MLTLNSRLNTIGISAAKGVDLVMQRDQASATLPRDGAAASSKQETTAEAKKPVAAPRELTPAERRQVSELQQIDRTVRAHEQAHIAAGRGVVTSSANFTYTYGPDGRAYAVGGEVGIDTSPERKPEDNIDKGILIQAAALAPRDPSPQDYQVAGVGSRLEGQGRSDLVHQQQEERIAAEAAREQRQLENGTAPKAVAEQETAAPAADNGQQVRNAYLASGPADPARINTFA